METFSKAFPKAWKTSATVTRVGRYALGLGAVCLLILGGLASALLAATPGLPVATTTATASTATVTTSAASAVVVVSGHGWGHGLGMSQWGAYGYAKHGWTFDRILAQAEALLVEHPVRTELTEAEIKRIFDDVEIIVDQIVGTSFFAVTPRPPMTVLARARMTAPGG